MKQQYIDLMENVLSAYSDEDIYNYTQSVITDGLQEHGYPRLTANIGIMLAHGRRTYLKDHFMLMMDTCCEQMPKRNPDEEFSWRMGNDFSVKEIVFCILELEKSKIFDKSITDGWRKKLSVIVPQTTYSCVSPIPPIRMGNWAAFSAASEQVRKMAGIGDESAFIENQVLSQLFSFDENGMYRDPNEPMVYDAVTRLQLAVALYCGFDGKGKAELEEFLLKSAEPTLLMQSVTGEIPFGGRSNQFLHNEAFYAALCEFYATWFKKQGDLKKAGQFKRAARIATEYTIPYLDTSKTIYHIKNYYDRSTKYGCEFYAYFDKYMVTAGSWFYLAYYFADDSIEEAECPAEAGKYTWQTSEHFHKVFANHGGYFAELETEANYHYDASGLGRIHKAGAPSAICCTVPFTDTPDYTIDITNPTPLSIACGAKTDGKWSYGWEADAKYSVTEKTTAEDYSRIVYECTLSNGAVITHTVTVSKDGVEISISGAENLKITLPVFLFDGKENTQILSNEKIVQINYKDWTCKYETDGILTNTNLEYANRNGHYKRFEATGKNKLTVKISIDK